MKFASTLLKFGLPISLMICLPMVASSQTNNAWAPTNTKATSAGKATYVADFQSGETIHIEVALELRNQAQLSTLAAQVAAHGAPPMTSQQFLANFAPTAAQAQLVVDYLNKNGFINIAVSSNNAMVSADGTAGTLQAAFQTKMTHYSINGRAAHANTNDVVIPPSLSGVVSAVLGLQNIYLPSSHPQISTAGETPAIVAPPQHGPQLRPGVYANDPASYPVVYGASSMAPASNTAIAIINIGSPPGSAGYSGIGSVNQAQHDLVTFAANEGYPAVTMHSDVVATSTAPISIAPLANQVTAIYLPSKGGFAPSPTIEWNLDTQVALAAAGGTTKQLLLYIMTTNSNSDQVSAFAQAVTDNMAKVISLSAANCESAMYQDGSQKFEDQIFGIM